MFLKGIEVPYCMYLCKQSLREKIFQGVRWSIPGPQILLSPQTLSGSMPLNHFCWMGVDLHLKVEDNDIAHRVRTYEKHNKT